MFLFQTGALKAKEQQQNEIAGLLPGVDRIIERTTSKGDRWSVKPEDSNYKRFLESLKSPDKKVAVSIQNEVIGKMKETVAGFDETNMTDNDKKLFQVWFKMRIQRGREYTDKFFKGIAGKSLSAEDALGKLSSLVDEDRSMGAKSKGLWKDIITEIVGKVKHEEKAQVPAQTALKDRYDRVQEYVKDPRVSVAMSILGITEASEESMAKYKQDAGYSVELIEKEAKEKAVSEEASLSKQISSGTSVAKTLELYSGSFASQEARLDALKQLGLVEVKTEQEAMNEGIKGTPEGYTEHKIETSEGKKTVFVKLTIDLPKSLEGEDAVDYVLKGKINKEDAQYLVQFNIRKQLVELGLCEKITQGDQEALRLTDKGKEFLGHFSQDEQAAMASYMITPTKAVAEYFSDERAPWNKKAGMKPPELISRFASSAVDAQIQSSIAFNKPFEVMLLTDEEVRSKLYTRTDGQKRSLEEIQEIIGRLKDENGHPLAELLNENTHALDKQKLLDAIGKT